MGRSTEPEIFTFERIPERFAPSSSAHPRQQRKRNTRVMYPANVRKYLPPAETNPAKRWLIALCLVVFLQIWTEEPCVETATAGAESSSTELAAFDEAQFTQYKVLPFQSVDEQVWQLTDGATEPHEKLNHNCEQTSEGQSSDELLNTTCPDMNAEMTLMHEQSTRNGYVVALLYPAVYHRLGGDN